MPGDPKKRNVADELWDALGLPSFEEIDRKLGKGSRGPVPAAPIQAPLPLPPVEPVPPARTLKDAQPVITTGEPGMEARPVVPPPPKPAPLPGPQPSPLPPPVPTTAAAPAAPEPTLGAKFFNASGQFLKALPSVPLGALDSLAIIAERIDRMTPEAEPRDLAMAGRGGRHAAGLARKRQELGQTLEPGYVALARAVKWTQQAGERLFPTNPQLQNDFVWTVLPNAFGSAFSFLGAQLATGGGAAIAGLGGAMTEASAAYRQAEEAGLSDEDKLLYTGIAAVLGSTEAAGVGGLLERLMAKRLAGGTLREMGRAVLREGGEEALQETVQTGGELLAGKQLGVIPQDVDILRETGKAAAAGAIVGGGMGAAGVPIEQYRRGKAEAGERAAQSAFDTMADELLGMTPEQLAVIQQSSREFAQEGGPGAPRTPWGAQLESEGQPGAAIEQKVASGQPLSPAEADQVKEGQRRAAENAAAAAIPITPEPAPTVQPPAAEPRPQPGAAVAPPVQAPGAPPARPTAVPTTAAPAAPAPPPGPPPAAAIPAPFTPSPEVQAAQEKEQAQAAKAADQQITDRLKKVGKPTITEKWIETATPEAREQALQAAQAALQELYVMPQDPRVQQTAALWENIREKLTGRRTILRKRGEDLPGHESKDAYVEKLRRLIQEARASGDEARLKNLETQLYKYSGLSGLTKEPTAAPAKRRPLPESLETELRALHTGPLGPYEGVEWNFPRQYAEYLVDRAAGKEVAEPRAIQGVPEWLIKETKERLDRAFAAGGPEAPAPATVATEAPPEKERRRQKEITDRDEAIQWKAEQLVNRLRAGAADITPDAFLRLPPEQQIEAIEKLDRRTYPREGVATERGVENTAEGIVWEMVELLRESTMPDNVAPLGVRKPLPLPPDDALRALAEAHGQQALDDLKRQLDEATEAGEDTTRLEEDIATLQEFVGQAGPRPTLQAPPPLEAAPKPPARPTTKVQDELAAVTASAEVAPPPSMTLERFLAAKPASAEADPISFMVRMLASTYAIPKAPKEVETWGKKTLGPLYQNIDQVYDAIDAFINLKRRGMVLLAQQRGLPLSDRIKTAISAEQTVPSRAAKTLEVRDLQQFSTPLPIGEAMAWAAGVRSGELVMEPTAGTGNLVEPFVGRDDLRLWLSEIDPKRVAAMRSIGYTVHDTTFFRVLPVSPQVIVMNPPWGGLRPGHGLKIPPVSTEFHASDISQHFVVHALRSLAKGGRLVFLVGENFWNDSGAAFRTWLSKNYAVRGAVDSPPGSYKSRGTTYGSVMVVVDKITPDAMAQIGKAHPDAILRLTPDSWEAYGDAMLRFGDGGEFERPADSSLIRSPQGTTVTTEVRHERPPEEPQGGPGPTVEGVPGRQPAAPRPPRPPQPRGPRPGPGVGGVAVDASGDGPALVPPPRPGPPPAPQRPAAPPLVQREPRIAPAGGESAVDRLVAQRQRDEEEARRSTRVAPYAVQGEWPGYAHPRLVVTTASLASVKAPDLTYTPHEFVVEANRRALISNEQMDTIARAAQNNLNGVGIVSGDATGFGKARQVAGMALDWILSGHAKRILVASATRPLLEDLTDNLDLISGGREKVPAKIVDLTDTKVRGRDAAENVREFEVTENTIYLIDANNYIHYRELIDKIAPDGLIADEAHKFMNQDTQRGAAWKEMHQRMQARNPKPFFAYSTATAGTLVDDLGYLHGLRAWPMDRFEDWLQVVSGKATPDELKKARKRMSPEEIEQLRDEAYNGNKDAIRLLALIEAEDEGDETQEEPGESELGPRQRRKKGRRGKSTLWETRFTPAASEQIMRELAEDGLYMSRDLWRSGIEYDKPEFPPTAEKREALNRRIGLMKDIQTAFQKFGRMNKASKVKTIRGILQFHYKRALFDMVLDDVVKLAKEEMTTGHQAVIILMNVSGTKDEAGEGHLGASINLINTDRVDKNQDGTFTDPTKIPEAMVLKAELAERLKDEAPDLRDPLRTIEIGLGRQNVGFVTGQQSKQQKIVTMQRFQDGVLPAVVLSGAGQTGLSAHHIRWNDALGPARGRRTLIVADLQWSAMEVMQAIGRGDRAGQLTAPKILTPHLGLKAQRKFLATIAVRLSMLGATSKGMEGSTGLEHLEEFELGGKLDNEAARVTYEKLPMNLKEAFTKKVFKSSHDPSGNRPADRTKADLNDFLLDLQLMPIEVADDIMFRFLEMREKMRDDPVNALAQNIRAARSRGRVLETAALNNGLTLRLVKSDSGSEFGVLSGKMATTGLLSELQKNGLTYVGSTPYNHYVNVQDMDAGNWHSGVEIPLSRVPLVSKRYGGKISRRIITRENIFENLDLGLKVRVRGAGNIPWELRRRKDGNIQIDGAKMADRYALLPIGMKPRAAYSSVGNYWFVPEEYMGEFLNAFAIIQEEAGPPTEPTPPEGPPPAAPPPAGPPLAPPPVPPPAAGAGGGTVVEFPQLPPQARAEFAGAHERKREAVRRFVFLNYNTPGLEHDAREAIKQVDWIGTIEEYTDYLDKVLLKNVNPEEARQSLGFGQARAFPPPAQAIASGDYKQGATLGAGDVRLASGNEELAKEGVLIHLLARYGQDALQKAFPDLGLPAGQSFADVSLVDLQRLATLLERAHGRPAYALPAESAPIVARPTHRGARPLSEKEAALTGHRAKTIADAIEGGDYEQVPQEEYRQEAEQLEASRERAEEGAPPDQAEVTIIGKQDYIETPMGRVEFRYEVVPISYLVTSHDPIQFSRNPGYPEGVQNRPYHSDKSEQVKVVTQAGSFAPGYVLARTPSATDGPPILSQTGPWVLGGNSRAMTMARVQRQDPESWAAYRRELIAEWGGFGFTAEDFSKAIQGSADQPARADLVVVRRLINGQSDADSMRSLARAFNMPMTQALNAEAEAVSRARQLSQGTLEFIADALAQDDASTIGEILRVPRITRELVRRLIEDGVFTDRDINRYNTAAGEFNDDGRRSVEKMLLGAVIDDPDLLATAPPGMLAKVGKALGALAELRTRPGWDLSTATRKALLHAKKVVEADLSFKDYLAQGALFGMREDMDEQTLAIAARMMDDKPLAFAARFRRIAERARTDIAGQGTLGIVEPADPATSFQENFGGPDLDEILGRRRTTGEAGFVDPGMLGIKDDQKRRGFVAGLWDLVDAYFTRTVDPAKPTGTPPPKEPITGLYAFWMKEMTPHVGKERAEKSFHEFRRMIHGLSLTLSWIDKDTREWFRGLNARDRAKLFEAAKGIRRDASGNLLFGALQPAGVLDIETQGSPGEQPVSMAVNRDLGVAMPLEEAMQGGLLANGFLIGDLIADKHAIQLYRRITPEAAKAMYDEAIRTVPRAQEILDEYTAVREEHRLVPLYNMRMPPRSREVLRVDYHIEARMPEEVAHVPSVPREPKTFVGRVRKMLHNVRSSHRRLKTGKLAERNLELKDLAAATRHERRSVATEDIRNRFVAQFMVLGLEQHKAGDPLPDGYSEFNRGALKNPDRFVAWASRNRDYLADMGINYEDVIQSAFMAAGKTYRIPTQVLKLLEDVIGPEDLSADPRTNAISKAADTVMGALIRTILATHLLRPSTANRNVVANEVVYALMTLRDFYRAALQSAIPAARFEELPWSQFVSDISAYPGAWTKKSREAMPAEALGRTFAMELEARGITDSLLAYFQAGDVWSKRRVYEAVLRSRAHYIWREAVLARRTTQTFKEFYQAFRKAVPAEQEAIAWHVADIYSSGGGGDYWNIAPWLSRFKKAKYGAGPAFIPYPTYFYKLFTGPMRTVGPFGLLPRQPLGGAAVAAALSATVAGPAGIAVGATVGAALAPFFGGANWANLFGSGRSTGDRTIALANMMAAGTMVALLWGLIPDSYDDYPDEISDEDLPPEFRTTGRLRVPQWASGLLGAERDESYWVRVLDIPVIGDLIAAKAMFKGRYQMHTYLHDRISQGPLAIVAALIWGYVDDFSKFKPRAAVAGEQVGTWGFLGPYRQYLRVLVDPYKRRTYRLGDPAYMNFLRGYADSWPLLSRLLEVRHAREYPHEPLRYYGKRPKIDLSWTTPKAGSEGGLSSTIPGPTPEDLKFWALNLKPISESRRRGALAEALTRKKESEMKKLEQPWR